MKKTYTCIGCPLSCSVTVNEEGEKLVVAGYSCKKGREYAINEHRAPKRMITGTVAIVKGGLRRLPVVGTGEIPKQKMKECMSQKYFKQQQDELGVINGHIEENYAGHNVVKVYNGSGAAKEIFERSNAKLYKSAWPSFF